MGSNGYDTSYKSFAKVGIIEAVIFSDKVSHVMMGESGGEFKSKS